MSRRVWVLAVLLVLALAAPASASPTNPCDPIDPAACMLPFPNDYFTKADASAPTGRRLDFSLLGTPHNVAGKPIDPTDFNRADGFSPGAEIVTKVPGMDNAQAFAKTDPVGISDIGAYADKDAPVVLLDATTGQRWPIWTELDYSIGKGADTDKDRMLLIRPAKNLLEGHRYVVALRSMRDANGHRIPAGTGFAAYRDGRARDDRAAHFESIFRTLKRAGIARGSLFLAWDFTVASRQSLSSRMLTIRDDAFRQLGDTNLADLKVEGRAPAFTLSDVGPDSAPGMAYDVKGTMDVPCYLSTLGCAPAHAQFVLSPTTGEPMQLPGNTMKVDFECRVPQAALSTPSRPSLYGHGLFGSYSEIHQQQLSDFMTEHDLSFCATDWAGMATTDVPNVATILTDVSNFPTLADRVQQGMLNFLYLGRLMIHPDGLCSQPPFKTASGCVIDRQRLFYDGNSQGGIIGGALTAVAPDFARATLGVPGMNYSTLLTRSTDFGDGSQPTQYATALYTAYPQHDERQLIFSLMQTLWDRAEPDGYAQHMTDDPYPGTPAHEVMLQAGYGDHQVSNVAAEVEARTIGARVLKPDMLPAGRAWETTPWWGLKPVGSDTTGTSVLTVWDGGSRPSPLTNTAQDDSRDDDPHEWVRRTPAARQMKSDFLSVDSRITDTCGGPCLTDNYPFAPDTAAQPGH